MSPQRFRTTITTLGTKAFVVIPFDPNDSWGARDRYYVTGTVAGRRIRGVLVSDGTEYFLSLGPAWRRDNAIEAGAEVEVVLEPEGPELDSLATDVAAALDSDPRARTLFHSIAPFYRKNFIRWVESAKRPETRAARIAEMLRLLGSGQIQR